MLMKSYLRILFALTLLAGSALAAAPQVQDGGNPEPACVPGLNCN
jgi:hypothetical protein